MGHPLNDGGHKLHVGVDDSVRVHDGALDGLPDLALQELSGEVRSHAVSVQVGPDLRLV